MLPMLHPSACKAFSEPHVPLPCSVGGSLLLLLHWGSHSSPPTPSPAPSSAMGTQGCPIRCHRGFLLALRFALGPSLNC